jgi:hypothetical protein
MQVMSKKEFVSKLIYKQYVKKLEKKKYSEIDAYIADSKQNKFRKKYNHKRR